MRIAMFSDSYKPQINGVVTQIENISLELGKKGNDFLIVAPSPSRKTIRKKEGKRTIFLLPSIALPTYRDYRITWIYSKELSSELESFRPDIIHVHTPFSVGILGKDYGKRNKIPVIGTYHTHIPDFLMYLPIPILNKTSLARDLAWAYARAFYNSCDFRTAPTKSAKEELENNGIAEVEVLPNAINFRLFNKEAGKEHGAFKRAKLIYFGRIGFEKNIEVLIGALKAVLCTGMDAELAITGSGPASKMLKKLAKKEGVGKKVSFHLPLKGRELAKHVAGHDIFVTASTIETQGLTIAEAMAAGLPCIGADARAIPNAIRDGENGYLFRPFDENQLAEKIALLVKSPPLREKLGKNAVETAREFSIDKVAATTEKLYKRVISSP